MVKRTSIGRRCLTCALCGSNPAEVKTYFLLNYRLFYHVRFVIIMEVESLQIETVSTPPTRTGTRIKRKSTRLFDIGEEPAQSPNRQPKNVMNSGTMSPQTPKSSILLRVDYLDCKTPTTTDSVNDQNVASERIGTTKKNENSGQGTPKNDENVTPARRGRRSCNSKHDNLREEDQVSREASSEENFEPVDCPTPVSRGRLNRDKKSIEDKLQMLATPPTETPDESDIEKTPASNRKGRKRKMPVEGETPKKRIMKMVLYDSVLNF